MVDPGLEGSTAVPRWAGVDYHAYKPLREKLEQDGTLRPSSSDDPLFSFSHDQVFTSPSAAAAVVSGRAANGRSDWKVAGTSTSYGAWQEQGIEAAS